MTTLIAALSADQRLREAYRARIASLEEQEAEAWARYSVLDRAAGAAVKALEAGRASKAEVKLAQKIAVRAHRRHQGILAEIMLTHRLWVVRRARG